MPFLGIDIQNAINYFGTFPYLLFWFVVLGFPLDTASKRTSRGFDNFFADLVPAGLFLSATVVFGEPGGGCTAPHPACYGSILIAPSISDTRLMRGAPSGRTEYLFTGLPP